jgi:hypothetical protein
MAQMIETHCLGGIFPSSWFESSSIMKMLIGQRVVYIGSSCFRFCRSLTELIFESRSSLRRIESWGFADSGLRQVVLPFTIEFIRPRSFANCSQLAEFSFERGSHLHTIGEFAFSSSSITSICLPPNLSSIDGSSLVTMSSIAVDDANSCLSVDKQFLYDSTSAKLIRYFGDEEHVRVRDGVEMIGESSFCNSRVRSIYVPKSVRILFEYFFTTSEELDTVEFEQDSTHYRIESFAFAWSSLKSISLPR